MKKALVIGDVCKDVFVYGHARRLSPETPCPILDFSRKKEFPGMAGNVARNLESLGFEVTLISNPFPTKKVRYVDMESGYQFMRLDTPHDYKPWDGLRQTEFALFDVIVVADYGKGFLEGRDIEIISKFADNGIPVFIDTKMTDLRRIARKAVVKINRREYENIDEKGMEKCHLIVTLGSGGAMYRGVRYPVDSVPVFDLMGAGDTFMAVLVWAMVMKKFSIKEAIEWANLGASIAVQKKGTATVTEEEIERKQKNIICFLKV